MDVTKMSCHDCAKAARDPNTPTDVLAKLAAHTGPDPWVRSLVAENPNTASHLVEALAQDPEWEVRAAVAARSDNPPDMLDRLTEDPSVTVRQRLLDRPDTPTHVLKRLAVDEDPQIASVARRLLDARHG